MITAGTLVFLSAGVITSFFSNDPEVIEYGKKYLKISKQRLGNLKKNSFFYFSEVEMTKFNGRVCTQYKKLPLINPDFLIALSIKSKA